MTATVLEPSARHVEDLMSVVRFAERAGLPLPRTLMAVIPPDVDDAAAEAMFTRAARLLDGAGVTFAREDGPGVQRLIVRAGSEVVYHLFRYVPGGAG